MFSANSSGAGIAWREKKGKTTVVKFEKGLDLEEITKLTNEVPLPYCAHFRIPTCGPRTGENHSFYEPLCHPFIISADSPLDLSGEVSSDEGVLFHNGHWTQWESQVKALALTGRKLPRGHWSDSRGMAWVAHHLGHGILDFIDEKAIVFTPHEIWTVATGWTQLDKTGVWVSNLGWRRNSYTTSSHANRNTGASTDAKEEHTSSRTVPLSQPSSTASSPQGGSTNTAITAPLIPQAGGDQSSPILITSGKMIEAEKMVLHGSAILPCGCVGKMTALYPQTVRFNISSIVLACKRNHKNGVDYWGARLEMITPIINTAYTTPDEPAVSSPSLPFAQALKELNTTGRFGTSTWITTEILRRAEALYLNHDQKGHRLLSKGKIKKFRRAHEKWKGEERIKQLHQAMGEITANSANPILH